MKKMRRIEGMIVRALQGTEPKCTMSDLNASDPLRLSPDSVLFPVGDAKSRGSFFVPIIGSNVTKGGTLGRCRMETA
jgi:hypothetical protein